MTTRMRRQAESLLVLADAERADGWAEDEEIGDVVRGSLSEIESYRQVAIAALEPIVVKGSAVDPLIHLLAELLENATQFSPPTTKVTVYGRQTDNGYHLAIIDHGLGMTPEELQQANAKLVSELDLLTDASTVIGHAVVAKIARRYGILVRLSDNQPGAGITANVLIPQSLIGTTGGSPARGAAMAGRSMGPAPSAHAQAGRRGSQASSPTAHVVAHRGRRVGLSPMFGHSGAGRRLEATRGGAWPEFRLERSGHGRRHSTSSRRPHRAEREACNRYLAR